MEELYQKLLESTVPLSSVICMMICFVLAFAIPGVLIRYLVKRYGCSLKPLLVGALTWIVFARVLEGIVHQIVLGGSFGAPIQNNLLYYALYAGAMAAIFEEFGRLLVMKTALNREFDNDRNALMYGVGHGGIEMIMVAGIAMIPSLMYASQINKHSFETISELVKTVPEEQGMAFLQSLVKLTETAPGMYALVMVERIPAFVVHIALSALVWKAVKTQKNAYFILSLAIHFVVDFVSVMVAGTLSNIVVAEAVIVVVCLTIAVAIFLFLKNKEKEELI
ncbi:MAG: YhfC family intramembrane metalloprotease [Lachnospiraceae bacterium]|nr:YhfC family intramembrane metalloprotease [Lachnospiraceae bacterium]